MKNGIRILLFLLFLSVKSFSQESAFCAVAGYKYQGLSFGEIGVNYSIFTGGLMFSFPLYNFGIGSEISYLDGEVLLGPKFVVEGNYVFIAGRLNSTYYINSRKEEFILTPEVGLTFFNIVNLYYGYNFRFKEKVFDRISSHRFTFSINIPFHNFY